MLQDVIRIKTQSRNTNRSSMRRALRRVAPSRTHANITSGGHAPFAYWIAMNSVWMSHVASPEWWEGSVKKQRNNSQESNVGKLDVFSYHRGYV
jgi:hypothetical protein